MVTTAACDKIILCAAIKGSFSEFPKLQLPNEPEHRTGGKVPNL